MNSKHDLYFRFEDSAMRDEPWNGMTNDTNNYGYTQHVYTKDMVTICLKIIEVKVK